MPPIDGGSDGGNNAGIDGGLDAGIDAGIETPDSGVPECAANESFIDGRCRTCAGTPGTFHGRSISVDGEDRFYFLHVPSSYVCNDAWPMLVDYHGTAGPMAEEAYAHQELIDLSDRAGFIVVRPRSRFSDDGFGEVYRWDQNPGDLERNVAFSRALVAKLAADYHLAEDRIYASGFSSGTNMVAQFMSGEQMYHGFAFVGGGFWNDPGTLNVAPGARVYGVTGYRDYLHFAQTALRDKLTVSNFPAANLFIRENDAGHELYGWHFGEIWAWLDLGRRLGDGPLGFGWTKDDTFPGEESLIEVARAPNGDLFIAGQSGSIFRRAASAGSAWEISATVAEPNFTPNLTGLCFTPGGLGFAVGEGVVARTDDSGAHWGVIPRVREFAGQYFGYSYLNTVACGRDESVIGAGYWTGVRSIDGGRVWSASDMPLGNFGVPAQVASVVIGTASTAIGVGYYWLGRSEDGETFETLAPPVQPDWLNDVAFAAPNHWWVAGESGAILASDDDGVTWRDQTIAGGDDFYAIDFWDSQIGLAVGAHGYAMLTEDGGAHWLDVSPGLDGFFGGVLFLSPSSAIVVGEHGLTLEFSR